MTKQSETILEQNLINQLVVFSLQTMLASILIFSFLIVKIGLRKKNAKASIRLWVKKELRGKVSISKLNDILTETMEQAEGPFSDWSA